MSKGLNGKAMFFQGNVATATPSGRSGCELSILMDYELIALSRLDDEGVRRLAELHRSVMHTLLSDLGLPLVLRYYQAARAEPSVIGICAVSNTGDMLGWAMGSPYPDMINSRLRRPLTWFAFQMIRLGFTHPLVLWQLITSVLSSSAQSVSRGSIELTYIGVAPSQRGKGLGSKLLDVFLEASRMAAHRTVLLSVEKENAPAIALYKKTGFKIIKTFSEGRYQRHRMELILE